MNFVKKLFLTVISIGTIIGLALAIMTSYWNKTYSSKLSELKTERTQQHRQLQVMREKIKNNLIANAKSSNSKRIRNSVQYLELTKNIQEKAKELCQALFNYDNEKEYLFRYKKVSDILAKSALSNQAIFPSGKYAAKLEGQKLKARLNAVNVFIGTTDNKQNIPLLMRVNYSEFSNNKVIKIDDEAFEVIFSTQKDKFISIKSIGKFPVDNSN